MSKERMQAQKEATLRQILDKAWEIVINEGINAISIRKLALAMDFAPNNLYNYFSNKNELMLYMKKDAYQWTFDAIKTDMPTEKSVRAVCSHITHVLLNCALKDPEKYIVMTSDAILDSQEPLDQELTAMGAKLIESGIASGELRKVDPVMTTINIRVAVIGFLRMISSNRTLAPEKIESLYENLMSILFDGLLNKNDK